MAKVIKTYDDVVAYALDDRSDRPTDLASYIFRCVIIIFLLAKGEKVFLTNAEQQLAH